VCEREIKEEICQRWGGRGDREEEEETNLEVVEECQSLLEELSFILTVLS
jgi:hypothetical protein